MNELSLSDVFGVPKAGASEALDSPLLSPLLQELPESFTCFDLMYVSHASLSWSGRNPSLESSETRVLSKNSDVNQDISTELLERLQHFLRRTHEEGMSLLFHPELFSDNKSRVLSVESAVTSCLRLDELPRADLSSAGAFDVNRLYLKANSLSSYQRLDVETIRARVFARSGRNSQSLADDAKECLQYAHDGLIKILCDSATATDFLAWTGVCPVYPDAVASRGNASRPIGIFWLFLRGPTRGPVLDSRENEIRKAVRTVWLLLNAYYVALLQTAEFSRGSGNVVEGFGHQVKKLPLGFGGKYPNWLLSKDEFDELQRNLKPPRTENEYRLVPYPELLDGVGDLITFWSFEYDPKSLLIDNMFESFACLMQYAADFATKSQRARAFTMVPMTTAEAANRFSAFQALRVSASDWSKIKIDRSSFVGQSGKLELTTENQSAWRQFAGLLRLLVVVCEGAIQYCSKTVPARVECKYPDPSEGEQLIERLRLHIGNPCRPKKERIELVSTRIGMKGEKIKEFISDKFLFDIKGTIKTTEDSDEWYEVAISLNKCEWVYT